MVTDQPARRRLAFAGALLFLLGGLTGGLVSLARTGAMDADAGSILGSHMAALLGGFWLVIAALSLQWSRLSASQERLLMRSLIVGAYANWIITGGKAFVHVHGVGLNGNLTNDVVVGLLMVFVVVPTLLGSGLWVWGLK